MNNLAGSDFYRTHLPIRYKSFLNQNLNFTIGDGSFSLLKLDGTSASIRTATKMCLSSLDGATQYAFKTSPTNCNFGTSTNFSIAIWVKTTFSGSSNYILSKYRTSATVGGFYIVESTAGYANFLIRDDVNSQSCANNNTLINDGDWHLITITVNRTTSIVTIYVDNNTGVETSISTITGSIDGSVTPNLEIGRAGQTSAIPFSGSIGETQIISGLVLTQEQVGYIYSYGIPDSYADGTGIVVAHYKWDSNGTDESSSVNTLTLQASPTISASTYTQYATYQSDGAIRLWGVYLNYSNSEIIDNYSMMLQANLLYNYNTASQQVVMLLGGSVNNYIAYYHTADKISHYVGSVPTLNQGLAYTSNSQLNTKKFFIASADYTNNIYELYINSEKVASSYSSLTQQTYSNIHRIGWPTNIAPMDIYKFAFFNIPLNRMQVINLTSAYTYAIR